MLKIGVLGASQRGHGYHYAKRLNLHGGNAPEFRARVTAVWDPEPAVARVFADEIPDTTVGQTPAQVAAATDAGMVTTLDPYDYLELAALWLKQGKPVFLNRPFAAEPKDARAIMTLAEFHQTRVWSASALAVSEHISRSADRLVELGGPVSYFVAIAAGTPLFYLPHALTIAVGVVGPGARAVSAGGVIRPEAAPRLQSVSAMAEIPRLTSITALIDYGLDSRWGAFQGVVTFQAAECGILGYEFGAICAKGRLEPQDYARESDLFGLMVQAIERFFVDGQMPTRLDLALEVCELYHAIRVSLRERRIVALAEFR